MNNYLYHYGIKGQSWGDRNGPPYPLENSAKSESEKAQEVKTNATISGIKLLKAIKNHNEHEDFDDEFKKNTILLANSVRDYLMNMEEVDNLVSENLDFNYKSKETTISFSNGEKFVKNIIYDSNISDKELTEIGESLYEKEKKELESLVGKELDDSYFMLENDLYDYLLPGLLWD